MLQRRANLPLQGQDRHDPGRAIRIPAALQVSKYIYTLFCLLLVLATNSDSEKQSISHFPLIIHRYSMMHSLVLTCSVISN
ncbi:Choline-phosphate cytidylyltransferase 2 [Zea mays]|jgi:hypothetical protein|uniref:Choline-phosphate cytidylyltransferase 2 n=1 Tax=Zea mays TaxID=4577 RepID=A0A1D6KA71_MAIZE|nr:Choline-phosphate cytidylyltransferase 2 [Zea mays]ONM00375.1 Choline-phosphate cytidylyltransferase 2 [Zea mays]